MANIHELSDHLTDFRPDKDILLRPMSDAVTDLFTLEGTSPQAVYTALEGVVQKKIYTIRSCFDLYTTLAHCEDGIQRDRREVLHHAFKGLFDLHEAASYLRTTEQSGPVADTSRWSIWLEDTIDTELQKLFTPQSESQTGNNPGGDSDSKHHSVDFGILLSDPAIVSPLFSLIRRSTTTESSSGERKQILFQIFSHALSSKKWKEVFDSFHNAYDETSKQVRQAIAEFIRTDVDSRFSGLISSDSEQISAKGLPEYLYHAQLLYSRYTQHERINIPLISDKNLVLAIRLLFEPDSTSDDIRSLLGIIYTQIPHTDPESLRDITIVLRNHDHNNTVIAGIDHGIEFETLLVVLAERILDLPLSQEFLPDTKRRFIRYVLTHKLNRYAKLQKSEAGLDTPEKRTKRNIDAFFSEMIHKHPEIFMSQYMNTEISRSLPYDTQLKLCDIQKQIIRLKRLSVNPQVEQTRARRTHILRQLIEHGYPLPEAKFIYDLLSED